MLDTIELEYAPSKNDFQINSESQQEILKQFRELFLAELKSTTGLLVVDTASTDTLELSISVTGLKINVPKDIERKVGVKIYSTDPVEMSISGALFQAKPSQILVSFSDFKDAESIVFEEVSKASVSADLNRIMERWAKTISKGIAELQ